MKRSLVNRAIRHALDVLEKNGWRLPTFAYWSPEQWRENRGRVGELGKIMLGWDVTDFGRGDFAALGAVLFTLRNGHLEDQSLGTPYAEKLIVLRHETAQALPMHFHRMKTEDIINRSGGMIEMKLYASTADGGLDTVNPFPVKRDGITEILQPGAVIQVEKGASVTLTPGLFHSFWAQKGAGDLVAGEVSSVNDDNTDNIFLDGVPRFSQIEEDEPREFYLCNEYHSL